MAIHDSDRVVVVTVAGELLGVLTEGDIEHALSRCAVQEGMANASVHFICARESGS